MKYERITGKLFAQEASALGENPEIGQFGSAKTGQYLGTSDIKTIQDLDAWLKGWSGAVISTMNFPPLPEMNGVLKVLSYQICSMLQQGVAFWDEATEYYTYDIVNYEGKLYYSLKDNNINSTPSDGNPDWRRVSDDKREPIATQESVGVVKPDGTTIIVAEDGTLTVVGGGSGGGSGAGLEIGDIGIALYVDETDGKRRRLNGTILAIDENTQGFVDFLTNLQSTSAELFCTEAEWQEIATASAFGQCGKFVLNTDENTVRLPKVVNIQGLQDLANAGMTIPAGLPNIDLALRIDASISEAQQAFFTEPYLEQYGEYDYCGSMPINSSGNDEPVYNMSSAIDDLHKGGDLLLNKNIYGASDTVQQEAVQYPFFIQVATGETLKNDIVNTLVLNNPFTLLECKFSDNKLYNSSWLLSNGEFYTASVYITAWEALLVEANPDIEVGETTTLPSGAQYIKRGLSAVDSNNEYSDYDFVLDTSNGKFRLPTAIPNWYNVRILVDEGSDEAGTHYRLYNDGYCEQWGHVETTKATTKFTVTFLKAYRDLEYSFNQCQYSVGDDYFQRIDTVDKLPDSIAVSGQNDSTGFDWLAVGYTDYTSEANNENPYLYYYVGETEQNINLINAGRVMEEISNYAPAQCVVETYNNGASGYRIWSDGFVEQWGRLITTANQDYVITLLKRMRDTNYLCLNARGITGTYTSGLAGQYINEPFNLTPGSFTVTGHTSNGINRVQWLVRGYIEGA